jgi:hypothetical protein
VPVDEVDKLKNLVARPDAIQLDPNDLAQIDWMDKANLDLP